MVDYRVLLKLSFSPQLKSDYEKVKTMLKEELQSASQDGDSCQNNQSELRLGGRDRVTAGVREPLGTQVPALRFL